jgi:membrane protein insertase Oxa1/YidC/SpoIIIJ
MIEIFITYIYQPFLNILVFLYWLTGNLLEEPDMGVAVVLFAIAVKIILLPIDLYSRGSDHKKLKLTQDAKDIAHKHKSDPITYRRELKNLFKQSPSTVMSEVINIVIQVIIVLMLYRIFAKGLTGDDLHLLYSFIPPITTPINLYFLGQFDLSHTNLYLNLIQSAFISLNQFVELSLNPHKHTSKEFASLVIIFPLVSFLVFMMLPSGKKLFIITSLVFSITIKLVKQLHYLYLLNFGTPKQEVQPTD